MRRVLLDNQIWNYLARPETGPDDGITVAQLRAAVDARHVELVGSFDLMQEMVAAARTDPRKAEDMVELMVEFAADRILLPLNERIGAEAMFGGLLSLERRYVDPSWLDTFEAMTPGDIAEMADAAYAEGQAFKVSQQKMRNAVRAELAEQGQESTARAWREWFPRRDIGTEIEMVIQAGLDHGDFTLDAPPTEFTEERFPSVAAFLDIMHARAVLSIGDGRRIQGSDLGDAHHVAAGPYVDVFVTEDRALRDALGLVSTRRELFETVTSSQFAALISAETSS